MFRFIDHALHIAWRFKLRILLLSILFARSCCYLCAILYLFRIWDSPISQQRLSQQYTISFSHLENRLFLTILSCDNVDWESKPFAYFNVLLIKSTRQFFPNTIKLNGHYQIFYLDMSCTLTTPLPFKLCSYIVVEMFLRKALAGLGYAQLQSKRNRAWDISRFTFQNVLRTSNVLNQLASTDGIICLWFTSLYWNMGFVMLTV